MKKRHETFRCEFVRCGRSGCKTCPHGPYWYAYWREGTRVRKRYVGKTKPSAVHQEHKAHGAHPWDAIFSGRTATAELAWRILGVPPRSSAGVVRKAYRDLSYENHPDRGTDGRKSRWINAAYSYLKGGGYI